MCTESRKTVSPVKIHKNTSPVLNNHKNQGKDYKKDHFVVSL